MNQTKYRGLGGFPGPLELADKVVKFAAHGKLEKKITMPTITTLEEKSIPCLEFDGLVVGRNSNFHRIVDGAEYRALRVLSYLVPAVSVSVWIILFI